MRLSETLSHDIYTHSEILCRFGLSFLVLGSAIFNRGRPYKWPVSENRGIFRDESLIKPASVNRF
jgi:hypothetical protein